jgi:4-hydroxybenzoate polyprenyltransferase/tetratricopeptide (TPR) repeat protein
LKRTLATTIERLETSPSHWAWYFVTFLAVVAARNLLEGALGPTGELGFTYAAGSSALMVLDHFLLFYASVFLAFSILLSTVTGRPISRVMRAVTPAWTLILLPPLLDYLLTGGEGVHITYVADLRGVFFRFFDPRAEFASVSWGQRVEITAACLLAGAYARVTTRSWLRAAAAFVGVYLVLALLGYLPSGLARLDWALRGGTAATPETIYAAAFREGGLIPDESRKLALLFFVVSSLLAWAALRLHAPGRERALRGNARPLRSAHYVGMAVFGVAFGWALFSPAGIALGGVGDALGVVGVALATFLAFQASVCLNDLFDEEGDRLTGSERPLVIGTLRRRDVSLLSVALGSAALLAAVNVKYSTFLMLALGMAVSVFYNAPPLRLKRFPVVSSLSLGLVSLLTMMVGLTLFAEERTFAVVPPRLAWLIVLSFGLGFSAKDLKDVDGDRATGVVTLPGLLGPRGGRIAVACLVALSYLLVPALLPYRVLLLPAAVLAALSASIVVLTRRPRVDNVLLAVCLAFTLAVAVVIVTDIGPLVARETGSIADQALELRAADADARGDRPAAESAYTSLALATPRDGAAAGRAGRALVAAGRFDEALPFLDRALSSDPVSPVLLEHLAVADERTGAPDRAESVLRRAVREAVRPRVFLSLLGGLELRTGRPLEAERDLRLALRLGQPDVPARLTLADALRAQGRGDEALGELRTAVRRRPSSAEAHDALGKVLDDRGEHDQAAAEFARATGLDPDEPVFWNNLAVAERLGGRYADALAALDRATHLDPAMPDPYYNRGRILDALGRHEEARRQYLLALETSPSFAPARRALAEPDTTGQSARR